MRSISLGAIVLRPPQKTGSGSVRHINADMTTTTTTTPKLNWIANYICGIADEMLRDLRGRDKYRDVILPMTVLRRLDAVLEPTKQAVLDMKASLDAIGVVDQKAALREAAGQAFCNTSKFTLKDLRARASRRQLKTDSEDYLDGLLAERPRHPRELRVPLPVPCLSRADAFEHAREGCLRYEADSRNTCGALEGAGSERQ